MVIKRLCFACTKSGKIVRFVLKNCTFRFRDYTCSAILLVVYHSQDVGCVWTVQKSSYVFLPLCFDKTGCGSA